MPRTEWPVTRQLKMTVTSVTTFPAVGRALSGDCEEHYSLDGELLPTAVRTVSIRHCLKTYSSICYAVNKTAIKGQRTDQISAKYGHRLAFSRR